MDSRHDPALAVGLVHRVAHLELNTVGVQDLGRGAIHALAEAEVHMIGEVVPNGGCVFGDVHLDDFTAKTINLITDHHRLAVLEARPHVQNAPLPLRQDALARVGPLRHCLAHGTALLGVAGVELLGHFHSS